MRSLAFALVFLAGTAAAQTVTPIFVTNSDDAGPGSLRDALTHANAVCDGSVDCRLIFDNAVYAKPIELESPLPVITACSPFTINFYPVFFVELRGSRLKSGNGLEFRASCPSASDIVVRRLVINGFPEAAVSMQPPGDVTHGPVGPELRVSECRLGTDVTGTIAIPNQRGVVIGDGNGFAVVEKSVISGNQRSGVFVWASRQVNIQDNLIGVGADGEQALGNGASGVYIGPTRAKVTGNTIAFNRDFGIALSRTALRFTAPGNSIFENGWQGIDWELNGAIDREISAGSPVPPAPLLTEAFYDAAAKVTVVRGTMRWHTQPGGGFYRLLLYVTPGWRTHAEGEQMIAEQYVQVPRDGGVYDVPFEFRLRDVRGSYVTVQSSISINTEEVDVNCSEFSNGILVQ